MFCVVVIHSCTELVQAIWRDTQCGEEDETEEILSKGADATPFSNNVPENEARIPLHHRYSAHTLNLVATSDALFAELHDVLSLHLSSVVRTCRGMWNKKGRFSPLQSQL